MRISVPGLARPEVDARTSSASAGRVYIPACSSVMPQSCVTAQPATLSLKNFTSSGGALEPETIANLSEDQSCASNTPAARQAAMWAGAVHNAVGFKSLIERLRSSGLNAGSSTVHAPTAHAQCSEYRP